MGDANLEIVGMGSLSNTTTSTFATSGNVGHLFSDGSDTASLFYSYYTATEPNWDKRNADSFAASGDGFAYYFTVPIAGWDAAPKPLLAFPTITYGQEPEEFHATDAVANSTNNLAIPYFNNEQKNTISNLGTLTNTSDDGLFFTASKRCMFKGSISLAYTAAGGVGWSLNTSSGDLDTGINSITEASCLGFDYSATADAPGNCGVTQILNPGDIIYAHGWAGLTASTTASRQAVTILVEPIQGVTNQASIIAQPVAILEDVKATNTMGGNVTAGTYSDTNTRVFNTMRGDIAAVGVTLTNGTTGTGGTNNEFTLPAGKYKIHWSCPFRDTNGCKTRLINYDDSIVLTYGDTHYNNTSGGTQHLQGTWVGTLTKSTALRIQFDAQTSATNGLGHRSDSTTDATIAKYSRLEITRMK
jgi:hypothetical protein